MKTDLVNNNFFLKNIDSFKMKEIDGLIHTELVVGKDSFDCFQFMGFILEEVENIVDYEYHIFPSFEDYYFSGDLLKVCYCVDSAKKFIRNRYNTMLWIYNKVKADDEQGKAII